MLRFKTDNKFTKYLLTVYPRIPVLKGNDK